MPLKPDDRQELPALREPLVIPEGFALDPALRNIINSNLQWARERYDAIYATQREIRDELSSVTTHILKTQAAAAQAIKEARETLGYCRALADRFLEQFGDHMPKTSTLPPMRDPMASSMELRAEMTKGVKEEFQQLARKTPGPKVESTPEQLTAVVTPIFEQLLHQREEALRIRSDRERLEAIDRATADARELAEAKLRKSIEDRAKFQRRLIYGAIVAFATSVAAAAGTYAFGQMAGRSLGAEEERTRHPQSPIAAPSKER